MDAAACINGAPNWIIEETGEDITVGVPPSFLLEPDEDTGDFIWLTTDIPTLIKTRIRCRGLPTAPRMDVETLIEPQKNRVNRGGFCPSGLLNRTGTNQNTDNIEAGNGCEPNFFGNEETEYAQLICGDFITKLTQEDCIRDFCSANAFPNMSVKKCMNINRWRNRFCETRTFGSSDEKMCKSLWDNDDGLSGPEEAINRYSTSLGQCEAGAELQYFDGEQ
eukprot:CAMPEP_0184040780 /NCGR_PEP_ID=MMETSP0955-20130417/59652_1 /TAXON_ID=627963 /ORGANISM="Aplanochytrium sp, Strain PBS07" /LENGTH=220 /DNA_ID=CAMNT_0026330765 /DNA_START=23 /DNA_END=682 /DNA_ORIENTATION=+